MTLHYIYIILYIIYYTLYIIYYILYIIYYILYIIYYILYIIYYIILYYIILYYILYYIILYYIIYYIILYYIILYYILYIILYYILYIILYYIILYYIILYYIIYVLCWAFVGRMLGVCWAHVGTLHLVRSVLLILPRSTRLAKSWRKQAMPCRKHQMEGPWKAWTRLFHNFSLSYNLLNSNMDVDTVDTFKKMSALGQVLPLPAILTDTGWKSLKEEVMMKQPLRTSLRSEDDKHRWICLIL